MAKNIVIGITGGISAYKIPFLVRELKKKGENVFVIMTESATKFVTPLTLQTLSENPVRIGMFDLSDDWKVEHISLADKADIIAVAPATANIIGEVASGIANCLLSTTIMATRAPVLFAPAMNVNMYENPIVQENIKKLNKLGYHFVGPEEGELACKVKGKGRLADTQKIIKAIYKYSGRV